ncbi:MAG: NADH-quinone oxidoreductase subunit N [Calditrichaeota bacterium]|nr:NADH-quinone oxidoreductase subunit N [Calditrichota bacterium]
MTINLLPFLPELILAGGILGLLIVDLIVKERQGHIAAGISAVLLVAIAGAALAGEEKVGGYLFGAVVQDGAALYFRLLFIAATLISIAMLAFRFRDEGEPYVLVLSSVLGMFLLAGSNDIVTLFVGFELVSIPSYILAGYGRKEPKSAEAALKYVLFGAMSSGLMLYGFSLLYGLTATTSLPEMGSRLMAQGSGAGAATVIGLILVLAGIGYKMALVPLHFWCPDVYEGSPTPITAFFSVAPKAAGFAALFRLLPLYTNASPFLGLSAVGFFTAVSAVTMTYGNLGAIWQTSLKRLLAYSSIAHAGYMLMGFCAVAAFPTGEVRDLAVASVMFYLAVYMFMNLGAFFVVDRVERIKNLEFRMQNDGEASDHISRFRGLGKSHPVPALLMAVFLFSLTGLPPLAGFIGKFYLLAALVKGELIALAIIAIANTVVSLFYYIRVIREMYLDEPEAIEWESEVESSQNRWLTVSLGLATVVPTIVLGVFFGPLAEWIAGRL